MDVSKQEIHEKARLLINIKRYDEAIQQLNIILQKGIADSETFFLIALSEQYLQHIDRMKVAIDRSLELDPLNAYAIQLLSFWYYAKAKNKKAIESIQRAIAIHPYEPVFFHISASYQYHLMVKPKKALETIEKGLILAPNHTDLLALKANIKLHLGDKTVANQIIHQSLASNPENSSALLLKAYSCLNQKKYQKAEAIFLSVLRIDPLKEAAKEGLFETKKHQSWLLRFFAHYGFIRYQFQIKGIGHVLFLLIFIKSVFIWGIFFILFLLFAWYGCVFFNSVLRLLPSYKYIISKNQIVQSNFFLVLNGIIILLIGVNYFFYSSTMIQIIVVLFCSLMMGISLFVFQFFVSKTKSFFFYIFYLLITIFTFQEAGATFFVGQALLLILYGLLFTFRVIGS